MAKTSEEEVAEVTALKQMLIDHPEVNNGEIEGAIKAGLTQTDVEWNQRLARPWLFHNTDAKNEAAQREGWYVANGVEPATAKEYVASGH